MTEKERKRDLVAQFKQMNPDAGVYRIVNRVSKRALIATSPNLAGAQRRFDFAKATNSPSALDPRLRGDAGLHGIDSFDFEVLEQVKTDDPQQSSSVEKDLGVLADLWRERFEPAQLY